VLSTIALTLQSFSAAIAFAPEAAIATNVVATTACHSSGVRYVTGPPPNPPGQVPNGLVTLLRIHVSPAGKVESATVIKARGNTAFDRAVVVAAKKGTFAPAMQNCAPVAGTYVFKAQTTP